MKVIAVLTGIRYGIPTGCNGVIGIRVLSLSELCAFLYNGIMCNTKSYMTLPAN